MPERTTRVACSASVPAKTTTIDPPTTRIGIMRQLGPGLIIAGSIVGSGELIATTAVGAEAGFVLMWLIIIGCLIKVFVQIEFGKYAIINGKTTLDGMNEVPGPRFLGCESKRANWICWFWMIFTVVALAQVGGLVGGVGQAMSIQFPLTQAGREVNAFYDQQIESQLADPDYALPDVKPTASDSKIWATLIALISIPPLVLGRYRFIQSISMLLVASFTVVTVLNLILMQLMPSHRVSFDDLLSGMTFTVPSGDGLIVALAAFGIIGVGATELIQYPYWCLEKGYAKWTGPRDDSLQWASRAEGWLRVLRWDAWASMVVYTFATIAFYLLGASILGRSGLNPSGDYLVRTLGEMYKPVFGQWAQAVFLFGAFAVLYSTFFVATASHARVLADGLRVFGIGANNEKARLFWIRLFSGVLPLLFLACFVFVNENPRQLVLAGGFMGALMLPLLGVTALYGRYQRSDVRLQPGKFWDLMLWLSVIGLFVAGGWAIYTKFIEPLLRSPV